jgi:hypothetical protein
LNPAAPERELYLYWRARADAVEAAMVAAQDWQAALAARHPQLECRLLRRADAGPPTLMEIYRRPGGIDEALADEIRRAGDAHLRPWLDGARHVEVFTAAGPG